MPLQNSRFRWLLHLLALLVLSSIVSGCASFPSRLKKLLLSPEFVYDPGIATTPPTRVSFKNGYRGELPQAYPLDNAGIENRDLFRPPLVTRDGWIEITPLQTPVLIKVFARNVGMEEGPFVELKSITGDIPYHIPSEIRFLDDVSPATEPVRIFLKNLNNPYNGYSIYDGALLMIEVIDPLEDRAWRYLFVYKDFGSRQKLSFNVVFNVPLDVLRNLGIEKVGNGVGNAAFTMSYSLGYRFSTQNPALQWLGDKTALVFLVGTSDTPFFGRQLFTNLSIGIGVEFYDFLSTNLLMDTNALGNLSSGNWGIVVGFDAVRFAAFSHNLTTRLLHKNPLK